MDELGGIEPLDSGHDVAWFDCGESALNEWLQRHGLKNQSRNNTRTFVVSALPRRDRKVVAFYLLVVATLAHADAIEPVRQGASSRHPIPVILLARLATDQRFQDKGLGRALLKDALRRSLAISHEVGVRAVLVHAKPDASEFYVSQAGFEPSPTDPLHLLLPIQDIAKALG